MSSENEKDLETVFNKICGRMEFHATRDLWPDIKNAIEKPKWRAERPLWPRTAVVTGFAVCAVVAVLFIPGASENMKNGIKRLFSVDYSFQLRDSAEILGSLLVTNAYSQEINIKDMLLRIQITSLDEKTVKIDVSIFKKQMDGSLKLLHRPAIAALKGKPAEIRVSDEKGPVYKLRLTPQEQKDSTTAYKCVLEPIKP